MKLQRIVLHLGIDIILIIKCQIFYIFENLISKMPYSFRNFRKYFHSKITTYTVIRSRFKFLCQTTPQVA